MFQQLFAFIQIQSQLQYLSHSQPFLRIMGNICEGFKQRECSLLLVVSKLQCLEFIMRDAFIDIMYKAHQQKKKNKLPELSSPQIRNLFFVFRSMIKQNLRQYQKKIKNFQDQRRQQRNEYSQQNIQQTNITLCLSCFDLYQKISKQVFDQLESDFNQNGDPLRVCIKAFRQIYNWLNWSQCRLLNQKKCQINSDVYSLKDKIFCSYRLRYLSSTIQKLIESLQKLDISAENKIIIIKILEQNKIKHQNLWTNDPPGQMIERKDYQSQFLYLKPKFSLQTQIYPIIYEQFITLGGKKLRKMGKLKKYQAEKRRIRKKI